MAAAQVGESRVVTVSLVATRLHDIHSSPTLALAAKAKALLKAGKPVIDLTAGEPDGPTPEPVKQAGIRAIQANQTKYTPVAGIPELREAIASLVSRQVSIPYDPAQALVSCGAKHSLYNALQAICNPGDEVIVFSPYWVSYPPLIQLAGGRPVFVETRESEQFQPDPRALESAITPRTKAIILNSPSNPTGAIMNPARLNEIAQLVLARQLIMISDEIYDQLVYPPERHVSILQVEPKLAEQTILVNGVSKTYSMTGWRIGYAVGPRALIDAMTALQSHSTSNPTSISQYAAVAALTGPQDAVQGMVREFQQRRDRLVQGLNRLPGVSCFMPQGAFYAWANIQALGQPADTIARRWLEEAYVATVPGEGFGSPTHVRLSFATSLHAIEEGVSNLARWCAQHAPATSVRRS